MTDTNTYRVAEGKSITTRRGVIDCDSERPELTFKDFCANPDNEKHVESVTESLAKHVENGVLIIDGASDAKLSTGKKGSGKKGSGKKGSGLDLRSTKPSGPAAPSAPSDGG